MITRCSKARPVAGAVASCVAAALFATVSADAAELYNDGDLVIRWDNTLRYTMAFRLSGQDHNLLQDPNADDGDRNFNPGLVANRIDLTSRLDIARDGFGFNGSAAAWYDSVYDQKNDNNSAATFNPFSVPHDQFTGTTRGLDGRRAELDDAFIYGNTEVRGLPLSFRIGRQTQLWGESLFFPDNGIAGAQAPIDVIRAATVNAAALFRRSGEIGVVAPGARADLLVLQGDPLRDLAVLRDPDRNLLAILKDGVFVRNHLLDL